MNLKLEVIKSLSYIHTNHVVHQMTPSTSLSHQVSKNSMAYNNSKSRSNPPAATPTMTHILLSMGAQSDLKTILNLWDYHSVFLASLCFSPYIVTESHLKLAEELD